MKKCKPATSPSQLSGMEAVRLFKYALSSKNIMKRFNELGMDADDIAQTLKVIKMYAEELGTQGNKPLAISHLKWYVETLMKFVQHIEGSSIYLKESKEIEAKSLTELDAIFAETISRIQKDFEDSKDV